MLRSRRRGSGRQRCWWREVRCAARRAVLRAYAPSCVRDYYGELPADAATPLCAMPRYMSDDCCCAFDDDDAI